MHISNISLVPRPFGPGYESNQNINMCNGVIARSQQQEGLAAATQAIALNSIAPDLVHYHHGNYQINIPISPIIQSEKLRSVKWWQL